MAKPEREHKPPTWTCFHGDHAKPLRVELDDGTVEELRDAWQAHWNNNHLDPEQRVLDLTQYQKDA